MAPTRVFIVDDHPVVRTGLATIIQSAEDMVLAGEAPDGTGLVAKVAAAAADLVVLDLCMPNVNGLAALKELKDANSPVKVLVLTGSESKDDYMEAMKLGCSGIVMKSTSVELLLKSIRKVRDGEIWLDAHTTAAVMRQFAAPIDIAGKRGPDGRAPLSQREREIVALVAQGHKNRDIAEKLFISEQTVKNHLHNVFDKLKVTDRLELALYAIHEGLHHVSPVCRDFRRFQPRASAAR